MRSITFVRHAMPDVDPDVSPAEWRLSLDGREAARATRIPEGALVASAERKAVETVALAAGCDEGAVVTDRGFGEVRRDEHVDDHFRERRRAWIRGEADERRAGWEPFDTAGARFDAALRRYPGDLVVGTHGMVLTAWFVRAGLVAPGEPAAQFWESLAFPDVVTVGR